MTSAPAAHMLRSNHPNIKAFLIDWSKEHSLWLKVAASQEIPKEDDKKVGVLNQLPSLFFLFLLGSLS